MIRYYYESFYYEFIGLPIVIQIAIITIIVFTTFNISLLLFFSIKKLRKKRIRPINKTDRCYRVLERLVTTRKELTLENLNSNLTEFKASCSLSPQEIIDILVNISIVKDKTFNHYNARNVSQMFLLGEFWDEILTNGSLQKKMKALTEVIELNASISESTLTALVYCKNHELRKRARIAQIHISQHDPFRFFEEEFDREFTEWDKLKIHNILRHRDESAIPNFARWIPSIANEDLQCLFIYEIGFYKQIENMDFVYNLFCSTKSDKVKIEILKTLNLLGITDYKDRLIEMYPVCSDRVQKSMIKNFNDVSNDKRILKFYLWAFEHTFETELKILIGKVILNSGETGGKVLNHLENKAKGFDRLIFDHVRNPLLN